MSAETERPLSGEDIDVIRDDLLDGVSSFLIARDYGVEESLILKAARGNLDYEHDAEHPPLEYDPETAAWSIPEEYQEDPEPPDLGDGLYTYGEGRLWRRTHQIPPWAADGGDSDEHDDADADADDTNTDQEEATQPTMTNTNTTTADDADSTETQTQTTIGKDKNGETVAGTSPDDFGSISTECWPSHIDPTDVGGELQRRIIQAAAMHRNWGINQIANHLGCTKQHTRTTLQEHWPSHQALAEATGRALTVDDVDEIRRRMVAGEPPSTLADEYDVTNPTIQNAAKGKSKYMAAAEHPPLEYDRSEQAWAIAEGEDSESAPEPESGSEYTPELESGSEMVALEHFSEIYHSLDESGEARCAGQSADIRDPLLRIARDEAEKVASECIYCRLDTRTSAELLDDIRAELGHSLKEEGAPLTKEELADVLLALRGRSVGVSA